MTRTSDRTLPGPREQTYGTRLLMMTVSNSGVNVIQVTGGRLMAALP